MSIFDSLSRNIKNIFVGSHKGDDVDVDWIDKKEPDKNQMIIPNHGTNRYHPDLNYSPIPRPEEEVADWFSDKVEKSDDDDEVEEEAIHEKMYKIATAKYNPFSVGGSEKLGGY
tara:strand:- start:15 stop:356 length:342 start_codon:yes stop_codon:yes gene_type:complete